MNSTNSLYDATEFQLAAQRLHDAREHVRRLPPETRAAVLPLFYQAVKGVYDAARAVYDPTTSIGEVYSRGHTVGNPRQMSRDKDALEKAVEEFSK